jgi:lipopolysaccharide transport system permease protein
MFTNKAIGSLSSTDSRLRGLEGWHNSIRFIITHWKILLRVTLTDLKTRYAGAVLGLGWMVLYPLLFLLVYAGVYLVIFQVRVPNLSPIQYVLIIFSGLVPFIMISEALGVGVSAVVANKTALSSTVFPIDLAPVKAVLLAQGTQAVGFSIILIAAMLSGWLHWTVILLPLVWGALVLFLIGLSWLLSIINVALRDLTYSIGLIIILIMIASPIAYTPDMVPEKFRLVMYLNPFAPFIIAFQKILVLGQLPNLGESIFIILISLSVFYVGGWFFYRAKKVMLDYV